MTAKPAAKSAAAPATETPAAPSFSFDDAPVPATTRSVVAVNPLADVCKSVAGTMNDGRSTVAKTVTAADAKQVAQIKRWLSLAGKDFDVTFRSIVEGTAVTFWAVTRINHKEHAPRGTAAK